MSFFAQLLGGAVSGYAKGGLEDIADREKLDAQMALLREKQQGQLELQRQRAEDQRALRELTAAQGGGRRGGGGDGTNVFDLLMNADTPEKQQRAVALLDAFGGSDAAALVSDRVYGRAPMIQIPPTAGDFARFDRGDPGATAVPQTTMERAAYDRDRGQQALQRLYALILDPAKTEDLSKAERQYGLNDMGSMVAERTLLKGGSLEDAASAFNRFSSPKDETEKNALAQARIDATRERTQATADNAEANRRSQELRKLQDLLARAKSAKPNLLDPNDAENRAAMVSGLQAQIDALQSRAQPAPAPAGNPDEWREKPGVGTRPPSPTSQVRRPAEAAKQFKFEYKPQGQR